MPIPQLTPAGLLPAGVYDATLTEIEQTFGLGNPRRAELFNKLGLFVAFAQIFGVFDALFVDGSFVTDKDLPGDIDGVLEMPRVALRTLLDHPRAFELVDLAAVKATYEVHLFLEPAMISFFQHLRPEEAIVRKLQPSTMRGILRVTL